MRVAFLLTGNAQTYEFCFPSTKKHILDVYNPDVFLCTNTECVKTVELYHPKDYAILSSEFIIGEAIWFRTAKHGIPKYDLLKEKDLEANWKVLHCNMMKQSSELSSNFKYDVVIVGRFDVKYCYIQPIEKVEENVLYIPFKDAHQQFPGADGLTYKGYSNQLCWMTSKTADNLIGETLFGDVDYVRESGFKVNDEPEKLLKYVCDAKGIRRQFVNIGAMIIKGTSIEPLAHDFGSMERYPEYL